MLVLCYIVTVLVLIMLHCYSASVNYVSVTVLVLIMLHCYSASVNYVTLLQC